MRKGTATVDLTTQMLQQLKDEKAAINETIAALERLAREQAKRGRSTDREVVRSSRSVTARPNGARRPSPRRK